jgi:hypothetical protein
LELFTTFKANHPKVPIMLALFQWLQPWFVHWLMQWNTCCCCYHTKMQELLLGICDIKTMGKGIHDHCSCTCNEVCNIQQHDYMQPSDKCYAKLDIFNGLTQLWMSMFCPKPKLSFWHAKSCLEGLCSNYGVNSLKIWLEELISN